MHLSRGPLRVSPKTDAPVMRAAAGVPEDRCTCHAGRCGCPRRQVHLSRGPLRVSSWTGAPVTRAAAGVLVDRCTCHAGRRGCRLTWSRESADATAACLVAGARVWRNTCGRRRRTTGALETSGPNALGGIGRRRPLAVGDTPAKLLHGIGRVTG